MDSLLALDLSLFQFIHTLYRSSFLDGITLLLSGVGTYGIIWIIASFWFYVKEEMEDDHWFFLPIVLALGSSLLLVELILKPLISRIRPSDALGLLVGETAAYGHSFPSGHATLAFAGATVLAAWEPKLSIVYYILAILIAWARIYLGVHYPFDIIAGAILGYSIGKCALWVSVWIENKRKRTRK